MNGRRTPRWLLPAAGAVAVVVVALVVARLSADPPAGGDADDAVRGLPATAAGPSGVDGAVPSGFGRSEAGAAAAATAYLATIPSLVDAQPADREAVLARMAAPGAPRVVADALAALELLDASVTDARAALPAARVLVRDVPLAYDVGSFHPDRVRVEIWSVGILLVEGRTDATEVWSTNTVELVWHGGEWRVWSWARIPGPVPAGPATDPTPSAALLDAVDGWASYDHVPRR